MVRTRGGLLRAGGFFPSKQSRLDGLSQCALRRTIDMRRYLDLDDIVLDGIDHQIADRVQAEFPHYVAAMCFHGLGAQVQERCDFLGTFSFRQKLSNFTFPGSKDR
jgi:hypothetical protein